MKLTRGKLAELREVSTQQYDKFWIAMAVDAFPALLDLIERQEKTLVRIASGIGCLSGIDCANIADQALLPEGDAEGE